MSKPIGELNGKWAVLFKVAQVSTTVVMPLVLAWGIWVTKNVYALEQTTKLQQQWMDARPTPFPKIDADAFIGRLDGKLSTMDDKLNSLLLELREHKAESKIKP